MNLMKKIGNYFTKYNYRHHAEINDLSFYFEDYSFEILPVQFENIEYSKFHKNLSYFTEHKNI